MSSDDEPPAPPAGTAAEGSESTGPPPASDIDTSQVSRAYEKVPYIGDRWNRWYDIPYKVLWFLQTGWRRRFIPRPVLRILEYAESDLRQFNELERDRAWDPDDPLHNLHVPADEHVAMPAMWLIELFPPSAFAELEAAIRRNGWDERKWMFGSDETNLTMLHRSRARTGWRWWRLASIQPPKGNLLIPDGVRAELPAEFRYIELKALQIGSGLTAVVAHVHLTNEATSLLDQAWHRQHQPMLVRRNKRLHALDRQWAGFHVTQTSRECLHALARNWLRENLGGIFAELDSPHTLIDMLILDKHDPGEATDEDEKGLHDAFRAIGVTEWGFRHYRSPQIPNMELVPTRRSVVQGISTSRTWTLWGQREAILDSASYMNGHGDNPDWAIAHRYDDAIESFLVVLAVSDMLEAIEGRYALIRDRARTQHGRFEAKVINELREQLLTLSIDVATVGRDLEQFWKSSSSLDEKAQFFIEYSRRFKEDGVERDPIDVNEEFKRIQREWFGDLTAADRDYRDILSTVSSLGASLDSSRTGRRALGIAFVSLVVASATVLVADIGDHNLFTALRDLFRREF